MALAGRCNSAPVPEQPAVRAPPGVRSERLGRPAASRCGVSCTLLGSHSPQIAPRDHRKLWFWPAVAGPSQAIWPRLGPHASPYAWTSAGRGKACSLLYINALRYTPQNHPSTGGARFGSQSSRSYLHRVLATCYEYSHRKYLPRLISLFTGVICPKPAHSRGFSADPYQHRNPRPRRF